jgi:hypothetical protein
MRYTNALKSDLVLGVEDGPWTFPETIKGLPKEANELRLGHMRGAPTMNYVREDVVQALRERIEDLEMWKIKYG